MENGGGISLLATRLGYAQLAEPVRFRNPWEQHASLRLRDGDTTVLADYDQHGRIHAGIPEQTMDAAAAAYVALTAEILSLLAGRTSASPAGPEPLLEPLRGIEICLLRYLPTNLSVPEGADSADHVAWRVVPQALISIG